MRSQSEIPAWKSGTLRVTNEVGAGWRIAVVCVGLPRVWALDRPQCPNDFSVAV